MIPLIRARDLMTRRVEAISMDAPVSDLVDLLMEDDLQGCPVGDGNGKLVGVVSRTDIVRMVEDDAHDASDLSNSSTLWQQALSDAQSRFAGMKVREIMSHDPVTADEDMTAGEIASLMLDQGIHRVVITEGEAVRGIVSATDLLGALLRYEEDLRG